jgi:excisionase family DNA binding protein
LTVPEAAAALHLSRWTIYELIRRRHLVSVKIGRCRRIPRDALQEYVARLREEEP